MSLILDGTLGLSDVDGSASTPAIRGTDSNTGMFFPAADTIALSAGGVQQIQFGTSGAVTTPNGLNFDSNTFVIDATNNRVGVGTASPAYSLDVYWNAGSLQRGRFVNISNSAAAGAMFQLENDAGNTLQLLQYSSTYTNANEAIIQQNTGGQLNIKTLGAFPILLGTNNTERMRIDSSGNLLVGRTSGSERLSVQDTSKTSTTVGANVIAGFRSFGVGADTCITLTDGASYSAQFGQNSGALYWMTNATERMRIDSSGNVLIGTTSTTGNGKFTNALESATVAASSGSLVFSRVQISTASNNATVDAFRFLDAAGNVNGTGRVSGHIYITANGASGADAFSGVYYLLTTSNGTLQATFTAIATQVRGTNPISSVQIANDGAGGAVKITVTYINNSGVVTGGATRVSFVGMLA